MVCGSGPFAGRLLIPFWHRSKNRLAPSDKRGYCVSVLYSDDRGKNWQSTEYLGQSNQSNESRLLETENAVVWLTRTRSKIPCQSRSFDGGVTREVFSGLPVSPARCCDIGAVSLSGKGEYRDLVLLSRVSHKDRHDDMEILISLDDGVIFWESFRLIEVTAMAFFFADFGFGENPWIFGLFIDKHLL